MKLKMELKNLKKEIGFNQKLYLDGIRQLKLVVCQTTLVMPYTAQTTQL